ncbi:hypothetical protein FHT70_000643 [Rhizobium sp. BK049]|nr:hypothetical protein [Rhizobium sp. BK049]
MPGSQSVIQAMGLASVLDPQSPDDYFLFVANDNDFLTQDGFQVGAAYKADAAPTSTRCSRSSRSPFRA